MDKFVFYYKETYSDIVESAPTRERARQQLIAQGYDAEGLVYQGQVFTKGELAKCRADIRNEMAQKLLSLR